MKLKTKRSELFRMLHAVNLLAQVKGTCRFAYGLAKNKKLLTDEVEAMRAGVKPSDELLRFDSERVELCRKHAEKDDKGEPKQLNGEFVGLGNHPLFSKELKVLQEKYKDAIETNKKQIESFNKMLTEDTEFECWELKTTDIPDNVTADQLEPLMPIIKDEENN